MMLKYTREIEAEWWMKLNFVFAASNWIFGPNHMGRVIVIFVRVTRSLKLQQASLLDAFEELAARPDAPVPRVGFTWFSLKPRR